MSALARYFLAIGKSVAGYDKVQSTLTEKLTQEGAVIHYEDNIHKIPAKFKESNKEEILIVFTPAVSDNHSELAYFKGNGFNIKKRAEILGLISRNHKTIAVAGTHGKTSVSTIIAHIFKHSGEDLNAILGGISKNYNSNLILSNSPHSARYAVTEADEFDRSFLHLHLNTAVITAIDEDHLDIYKDINDLEDTFSKFVTQIEKEGSVLMKKGIKLNKADFPTNSYTYSVNEVADFFAINVTSEGDESIFDLILPNGSIDKIKLGIPGLVNIENAVAAAAIAHLHGIEDNEIKLALETWTGVKRRFEYIIKTKDFVYIDDYAHHPEELKALINSVRGVYQNRKITGIFQPHLYTRTRDFAVEFAKSLDLLDELILLDIYPAREKPIKGVKSDIIFKKVKLKNKTLCKKEELLSIVRKTDCKVLLSIGAGDIACFVKPIKRLLS